MTKQQTQIKWAKNELKTKGQVSRNQALRNYISRLGAIIWTLKDGGMKIHGGYVRTKKGRDYVYTLIK